MTDFQRWDALTGDALLDALLDSDVVQLMMLSDGVMEEDIRDLVASVAQPTTPLRMRL